MIFVYEGININFLYIIKNINIACWFSALFIGFWHLEFDYLLNWIYFTGLKLMKILS